MAANRKSEVEAAAADVDFETNNYQLELDTTMGKITLKLMPEVAPGHCKNLIGLAKIGYYDGLIFHRIIPGFMVQGGCPNGNGAGGPGYTIDAEFNDQPHEPGVLSMARTQDPNSAGSQFFHLLGPSFPFGRAIHGVWENRRYRKFGCCGRNRTSLKQTTATARMKM